MTFFLRSIAALFTYKVSLLGYRISDERIVTLVSIHPYTEYY